MKQNFSRKTWQVDISGQISDLESANYEVGVLKVTQIYVFFQVGLQKVFVLDFWFNYLVT
jgi:hypothetical protein